VIIINIPDDRFFELVDIGQRVKGKDIPVTGHGGPKGCERSRLPNYLDKRLTDGSKVVSPTPRPHFTPRFLVFFFFKIPGTHFC
jgi:hypothetical protein